MIQILVYIVFSFLCLQFCNVLINNIFNQKIPKTENKNDELISVLIPARNEEKNIGNLLNALQIIKDNNLEILVCNDHSTDKTEELIKEYTKNDTRVKLIQSEPLPLNWLGKNHTCYQLAKQAKGQYFLFIDADVILTNNIIADAFYYVKKQKISLLSIFPKQIQLSIGEKATVPLMNYILLTLLPLIFVKKSPFAAHAAANGQFMLFDATMYKQIQPHLLFKNSAVEDIAISKFYKSKRIPIACITGEDRVLCRMYSSYNKALNGFAKNIFMFFGNIPVLAFLFWIFATLGIIPIILYNIYLSYLYLLIVIVIQILYAVNCKQKTITTILFFPVNMIFMLQVLIKALIVKKQKKYSWKGRNIYS